MHERWRVWRGTSGAGSLGAPYTYVEGPQTLDEGIEVAPVSELAARSEALREALELAQGAIKYVREPHHRNRAEECSLCPGAIGNLDLALERIAAALDTKEDGE